MAKYIGVTNLLILSDSQLIVNQITEEYQAKELRMTNYPAKVRDLLIIFLKYKINKIPILKMLTYIP